MRRRDKDYSQIRSNVQQAALLIAEGTSDKKAAHTVGLPRSSLQRYLKNNRLPDGLPIWPEETLEQQKLGSGNEPAGAAHSGEADEERCPKNGQLSNREQQSLQGPGLSSDFRGSDGKFQPGNQFGTLQSRPAREAKRKLEEFSPKVAEKLIRTFKILPSNRPDLILAFGKEILDRGLGKPVQAIDLKETHTHEEYQFIEALIVNADAEALRSAAALAQRLEEYARQSGGAPFRQQVEIIPPPGGTLHNLVIGGGREVSETDNLDASATRKE